MVQDHLLILLELDVLIVQQEWRVHLQDLIIVQQVDILPPDQQVVQLVE